MKILVILAIVLIVGGFFIVKANNLDLNNPADRGTFLGKFVLWLKGIGENTIDAAGYVIHQNWLPESSANETNSTK